MLETKCVGDTYKMLVTVLAILVTKIHYVLPLVPGTNISILSPTSRCHQHKCHLETDPERRFVVATNRNIKIKEVIIIYLKNINWLKNGFLDGTGRHSQHVPLLFPKPPGGQMSVKLLAKHLTASRFMQSNNS